MRLFGLPAFLSASIIILAGTRGFSAESQAPAPDFNEVYGLIRSHLSGVSETELNRRAVLALVSALSPKVSLFAPDSDATNSETALVSKSAFFEGKIAYLRLNRVDDGLDKAVGQGYERLATNKLNGVVLDLRYASGQDYPQAASVADLFVKKEQPLMDWGKGMVRSKPKSEAISLPVAVLVNGKTAGAAEAIAAVLRQAGVALLLGSKTAGQAMIAQEYPLKEGGYLRIATGPIQLGDGSTLSAEGVKPDINVEVNPADEQQYYADAFKEPPRPNLLAGAGSSLSSPADATNRSRRSRLNEAELVRERRDGVVPELEPSGTLDSGSEKPVVRDPVLARALDVLKGLAVIRQSHS